jgi:phenylacetate-coenzyme A ligase PaaK-like adenylate-forming protein
MRFKFFNFNNVEKITHRFINEEKASIKTQKKALQRLITSAEKTKFGGEYNFTEILKNSEDLIVAFQENVPIHDYDEMFKWWKYSLEGEKNITWPGQVKYFALSSGTSGGPSKYIPITEDMHSAMKAAARRILITLWQMDIPRELIFKKWLMVGGSATLKPHKHSLIGDLSGINGLKPPVWMKRFKRPGLEITKLPNWEDRCTEIAKNAKQWDISIISGIPSWVQLTLEKVIEYHGVQNIHEIWPNLTVFITGGIAFGPYQKRFERLLGKPITYLDTYLASEGFIAYQKQSGNGEMKLLLKNGIFFEFIPFNHENFNENGEVKAAAKTLTINQVEENVDYALLISTCAGAWRYLIGDIIKFTNKSQHEIIITGRTKHFLSVCGEHLSVDNMNKAIHIINEKFNLSIGDYTVGAVAKNHHFAHLWYLGVNASVDAKKVSKELDDILKVLNDDYQAERGAMLHPPSVKVIPEKWFYDWMQSKGKLNGQSKVPRVMKGENFVAWEAFVKDCKEHENL